MSRTELHKKLDEIASVAPVSRRVSHEHSERTPIWNALESLWMESDVQYAKRLRAGVDEWPDTGDNCTV